MKLLKCEMCSSTDIIKEDGMYVCQSCGIKYSVEEAKKMMVEGTVDVQGTVKVDDSAKINNYYTMAENSYDAGNKKEAENYCNKILEIDSTNYKAWFLKGKAVGWQSTLANIRTEESKNCFEKAITNAPDNQISDITQETLSEFLSLLTALVKLCCDHFAEFPSKDNGEKLIKIFTKSKGEIAYFSIICDKDEKFLKDFLRKLVKLLDNAVDSAWQNKIIKDYHSSPHPSDYDFDNFVDCCKECLNIIGTAQTIQISKQYEIARLNKLILISTEWMNACSYEYSTTTGNYYRHKSYGNKEPFIDQIMKFHQSIKELDPTYEIPERPCAQPNTEQPTQPTVQPTPSRGACYVATAVYGSYDCPEVWTLRRFRDNTLAETWYGRAFIHTYYAISPTLVKWFGHTEWFKKMWKGKLDRMVKNLQDKGYDSTPYEDKKW